MCTSIGQHAGIVVLRLAIHGTNTALSHIQVNRLRINKHSRDRKFSFPCKAHNLCRFDRVLLYLVSSIQLYWYQELYRDEQ